jgi:hypothetical protein
MAQHVDDGTKLMQGLGGQMNKLNKQDSFHDIVFVLRYKYVPAHKKA